MKTFYKVLFGILVLYSFSQAQTVPALIGNSELFDGKTVVVKGELIGDIIEGRSGFWVNLLESENAIGVWLQNSEKEKIKFLGRYGVQGDIVQIEGIFHKNCIQHKGDMDIHAVSLKVLQKGMVKEEQIPLEKVIFAFSLGIVSLAAIGILHLISRRESPPSDQ